jgi:hypothetical protein
MTLPVMNIHLEINIYDTSSMNIHLEMNIYDTFCYEYSSCDKYVNDLEDDPFWTHAL